MNRCFLTTIIFLISIVSVAQPPRTYTSSEIFLDLKKLGTSGSVLYIAAHPDDENTRLLAYLANGLCMETNYLSLTRGDGGQNLIGSEKGIDLGIIRTQELIAARRTDGAGQFFTRAYDFGFSKNPEETFTKWKHEDILEDVVWVIRLVKPDVIITRFGTDGSGGHGHHTASALLAEEAFEAAADPNRFPHQLKQVEVWQAKRMFWNMTTRFRNPNADMSAYIPMDVGGYNALIGKSYGEISAESRSMHKSQGFGSARQRGEMLEHFKPLKGDTTNLKDIFQGLNTTPQHLPDYSSFDKMVKNALSKYNFENPSAILPELLAIKSFLQGQKDDYYKQKEALLDEIIIACAGLVIDITAQSHQVAIQDTLKFDVSIINRSNAKVVVNAIEHKGDAMNFNAQTGLNKTLTSNKLQTVSAHAFPLKNNEQKHWLSQPMKNDIFTPEDASYRQLPQKYAPMHLDISFSINNVPFTVKRSIQYKWTDPEKGELYRPLVVTAPVMMNMVSDVVVFSDKEAKQVFVSVIAGKDNVKGKISLQLESGWVAQPQELQFVLDKKGEEKLLIFSVRPPAQNVTSTMKAIATVDGKTYSQGFKEITYDHIPVQTSFPEAEAKLIRIDLIKKSNRIGYIEGAGDDVAVCLEQIGYSVDVIKADAVSKANLAQYDAIVMGVRAFNTNENLFLQKSKLLDYVNNGGNLIVQYNTNSWSGPIKSDIGPYPFNITRDRVTDENAKVNFDLPNHPALNTPNKITPMDFEGWIQERSIYHAGNIDSAYEMPISMADPGESATNASLIIAKHGKGHFVYTGLVFFRELPAGVPGAYRLFVNLIELGK
jgi:LmbE family N-acetylglucosaminyl deacetylase